MRKIILAASGALAIAAPAFAADLSPRPAPAPLPLPLWTGFYIGANAGGAIGVAESDFSALGTTFASVNNSLTGAVAGGQVGYNWQSGPMVYGVEADIQFSSAKGTLSAPCAVGLCGAALTANYSQEVSWFGTLRGRVGYASGGWLVYATGGYAYGQLTTDANASAGPASATFSAKDFIDGWTAGGGIEVQFAPRWSLKGEYLYADLGRANHTFVFPGVPALNDSTHVTLNIVRAGVNFRF
jgi:opacity protein-like surface antigen